MTDLDLIIAAQVAEYWQRERELERVSPPSEAERRARAATAAERHRLTADGVPADVIKPGTTLSDATLLDPLGTETTLYQAIPAGQPAVIVFYRGAWCPFCNIALQTYQEVLLPQLQSRDVALVAVSPQKPDGSLTMKQKHGLTFSVLSDPSAARSDPRLLDAPSRRRTVRARKRRRCCSINAQIHAPLVQGGDLVGCNKAATSLRAYDDPVEDVCRRSRDDMLDRSEELAIRRVDRDVVIEHLVRDRQPLVHRGGH